MSPTIAIESRLSLIVCTCQRSTLDAMSIAYRPPLLAMYATPSETRMWLLLTDGSPCHCHTVAPVLASKPIAPPSVAT